jgi:hypothetical protein
MVSYIASKYKFVDVEGESYAKGRSPSTVFLSLFNDYTEFHYEYPEGLPFEAKPLDDLEPVQVRPSKAWMGKLCELQQQIIDGLIHVVGWRADAAAVVKGHVEQNPAVSPESILHGEGLRACSGDHGMSLIRFAWKRSYAIS